MKTRDWGRASGWPALFLLRNLMYETNVLLAFLILGMSFGSGGTDTRIMATLRSTVAHVSG